MDGTIEPREKSDCRRGSEDAAGREDDAPSGRILPAFLKGEGGLGGWGEKGIASDGVTTLSTQ